MYNQIAQNKRKSVILVVVFILILTAIGWFAEQYIDGGQGFMIIALLFSTGTSIGSYFASDKIALAVSGAKGPLKKEDNAYVYRMVENLSITAGLPMPRVYIIEDNAMNAFATGRDPKHAAIAVTTGLIKNLENEELEGVIAHELAHIKNYDIRFMTLVAVLVGTVVLLSDYMFRWGFIFGRGSDNRNSNGVVMAIGLVLLILSPIIAQLIKFAVSRKREFLADAEGSLLTRYPEGLAKALEKISHSKPLDHASKATAHLFISNPFGGGKVTKGMAKLFSTHPPVAERVSALRNM